MIADLPKYSEKYPYPTVVKESTTDNGRVYYVKYKGTVYEGLKSVTTILSRMSDKKEVIAEWRRNVGHEKADFIVNKSLNIGNNMHDILNHRIIGTPNYEDLFKKNFLFKLGTHLADKIETDYLSPNLDEVWGSEVPLFVPDLYAGRTDLVGIYNGVPSIIDFKNSYNEKKEEHMDDYFIQSAAYAMAHNYLFDTEIKQCVILIGNSSDITCREFIKEGDEFKQYSEKWLDMLNKFFE